MKNILLFTCTFALSLSASAATFTYKCVPFKNNRDPFLDQGHALVTVKKNQLRFQQFNGYGRNATLMRDYLYKKGDLMGGQGKVKGMQSYYLSKEIESYGDSIHELFVDPSLQTGGDDLRLGGKGGRLTFTGHGYSYDWNICINQNR